MVKYIFLILFTITFLNSCGQKLYKIEKDQFGEPLLNHKAEYSFTEKPTDENLKKIDTSAYYVQIFEGRYYNEEEKKNPKIIIFDNDGFFKNESPLYFGKFDEHRKKNSVYYGGQYKLKNNIIQLETFGKSSG